jgi:hypothetical protein
MYAIKIPNCAISYIFINIIKEHFFRYVRSIIEDPNPTYPNLCDSPFEGIWKSRTLSMY